MLPAQSLTSAATAEIDAIVRRLGPALGVVGLLNVQLAIADDEVFVLEVNPRASRTVPFASKATGVNLVDAACRLAAGRALADLGLPAERPPRQVSVKAAVLPFARFPGADPVLGPEMRATGEVMASAADLADRVREGRARRRAARCRARAPSSSRCATPTRRRRPGRRGVRRAWLPPLATAGTARTLGGAGLEVDRVRKVNEPGDADVVDLVRRGRCDLSSTRPTAARRPPDGYAIREAALVARVPCITTIAAATRRRACDRERARRDRRSRCRSGIDVETAARAS